MNFNVKKNKDTLPFFTQKSLFPIKIFRKTGRRPEREASGVRFSSGMILREQYRFNGANIPGRSTMASGISGTSMAAPPAGSLSRPRYRLAEQEDLAACSSELSISTASQNTPTANSPKAQAPATERTVLTIFPVLILSAH